MNGRTQIALTIPRDHPSGAKAWRPVGVLLSLAVALVASAAGQVAVADHTLTSADAVHSLSAAEARRALPVKFRATVTFYDAKGTSLFVSDATGGVYVRVPWDKVLPMQNGSLVEVTGVSAPGDFAAIVSHGQIKVLGQSRTPLKALRVTVAEISTGMHDCRWVEVEGLIRSVSRAGHMAVLKVATRDGPILALTPAHAGDDYGRLINATVRVRGVTGMQYNKHQQMTGSHLLVPSLDDVKVLRLSQDDPYALPVRNISQLGQFDLHLKLADRIHLRGRMVLQWPGHLLCLQDATGGVCVDTPILERYQLGRLVDLVGYPIFSAQIPALSDAMVRQSEVQGTEPVTPRAVSAKTLLNGDDSGQLVSIEGDLVGVSSDAKAWHLTISSGETVFDAVLAKDDQAPTIAPWKVGSYVRLVGVCMNEVDPRVGLDWTSAQKIASFRLMMRSAADVVVVRTPSWWTPEHTSLTLGIAVLVTLAVFGWVVLLRRQVEQRTQELKESERRFRHLAHHDSLTGVPDRAWFHERAERALEYSRRNGDCVGLLLLDLDHFKPVNDTLGHDAGDAMLCALAQRVTGVVRKVDTVARLGGDEFAVVLVGVTSGADAELVAQKVLKSVCQPLEIKGNTVMMSASIGVAVFPGDGDSVTELLRSADLAMYESKKLLRGGVRRYRHEATVEDADALEAVVGLG